MFSTNTIYQMHSEMYIFVFMHVYIRSLTIFRLEIVYSKTLIRYQSTRSSRTCIYIHMYRCIITFLANVDLQCISYSIILGLFVSFMALQLASILFYSEKNFIRSQSVWKAIEFSMKIPFGSQIQNPAESCEIFHTHKKK